MSEVIVMRKKTVKNRAFGWDSAMLNGFYPATSDNYSYSDFNDIQLTRLAQCNPPGEMRSDVKNTNTYAFPLTLARVKEGGRWKAFTWTNYV